MKTWKVTVRATIEYVFSNVTAHNEDQAMAIVAELDKGDANSVRDVVTLMTAEENDG